MAYMDIYNYDIYNSVPSDKIIYSESDMDIATGKIYVSIDDDIVYVIQALNKKGYFTKFCCSGHYGYEVINDIKDTANGYIFFKNPNVFKNLPVGVIQETSHILRFVFKTNPNTKERFYELNNIIYDLAQWVDNLK